MSERTTPERCRPTVVRQLVGVVPATSPRDSAAVEQALLVTALFGALLARLSPSPALVGTLMGECWLHRWFAIPCPTCGVTRALLALAHADLRAALSVQPLATLTTLAIAAYLPWAAMVVWRGWQPLRIQLTGARGARVRIAIGVAVLVNWAYLIHVGV